MSGRKQSVKFSYYKWNRLNSYNGAFNMVIGARGLGKTYGCKRDAIKAYLRDGSEFIYLRRYQKELSAAKQTFFDDVKHEFPDLGFRVNGNLTEMTYNPEAEKPKYRVIGYFRELSRAQSQKSMSFINVTRIIFDEFIIEKGMVRYLPEEVTSLLNFYLTVDRYQDRCKVYMLANSVSIMNPYFLEWEIEPKREFVVKGDGFVVCHFADSEMFRSEVLQTRFGKFIAGTGYGDYSAGNVFADDADYMLAKKNSNAQYYATIRTNYGFFSVWYDRKASHPIYYVQQKRPKSEIVFCTELELMTGGFLFMPRNHGLLQNMRAAFHRNMVMFDSSKSRNSFVLVFK